jgi:secreted PhoX family phosphatase
MERRRAHERPTLFELANRRLTRRTFVGALAAALPLVAVRSPARSTGGRALAVDFEAVPASTADTLIVPSGFRADVLLSWGDPLFEGAAAFDWRTQSAAEQERRFGFNCDFNAWFPLGGADDAGVLCTNHEYTNREDMFPAAIDGAEAHALEIAAHGLSFVELARGASGRFERRLGTTLTRRVTGSTPMRWSGPAAHSAYLATSRDPRAEHVLGTLGNCGGGRTPWGTVLTCEENVHEYFSNLRAVPTGEGRDALERYGFFEGDGIYSFARFDPRFDLAHEPNEANRFGWIVEVDPFDAAAAPIKHTALGRLKHEAASVGASADGRVVVYTGDDEANEYLYKYVSRRSFKERAPRDGSLLSDGVLHVARFDADGGGEWLPLVPEGPLERWSPARIAVHTRLAADLVGATPLDRPEDVEISPLDGRVYVCLTNNKKRTSGDGGANPRAPNPYGQVLELVEHGGDLAARRFSWTLFLVCGDDTQPERAEAGGRGPAAATMARPDNLASDRRGNLWITTDGQPDALATNDAMWVVPTSGPTRAVPRRFLTGPIGCEVTGPEFTPDGRTLFLSIQHPGEGGGVESPTSRWPDRNEGPPRPSVIAIERADGAPFA